MARPKGHRKVVRLSVTLDEEDYTEMKRLGTELNLSTAWLIRRATSEFIEKNRNNAEPELPLRQAK